MNFEIIVAMNAQGLIGNKMENNIPWPHIPEDMAHFRALTMGHIVIMGRHTWESLPQRPLVDRINIVMTREPAFNVVGSLCENTHIVNSIEGLASLLIGLPQTLRCFVIGGAILYKMFMPYVKKIIVTEVDYNEEIVMGCYFPVGLQELYSMDEVFRCVEPCVAWKYSRNATHSKYRFLEFECL